MSKVNFSTFLSGCFFLYLLTIWVSFSVFETKYIDLTSMAIVSSLVIFFILTLNLNHTKSNPYILLIILLTVIYYLIRFWSLFFDPTGLIYTYTIPYADNAQGINHTLSYLLITTVALIAGINIASRSFADPQTQKTKLDSLWKNKNYLKIIIPILFLTQLFGIFTILELGIGRQGNMLPKSILVFVHLFQYLFHADVYLLLSIPFMVELWPTASKKEKTLIILAVSGYVIVKTIGGSKAGLFHGLSMWVIYKLVKEKNFKVNVKKIILLMIPIVTFSVVGFFAGKTIRYAINFKSQFVEKSVTVSDITDILEDSEVKFSFSDTVLLVFKRLEGLDSINVIINKKEEELKGELTLTNEIKSTLNLLLPGRPFEVPLSAQQYAITYFGVPAIGYTKLGLYTTYIYYIPGYLFAYFGWSWGVFAGFGIGFFFGWFYERTKKTNPKYSLFWQVVGLYTLYWFFINQGIDFITQLIVQLVVCLMFFLWFMRRPFLHKIVSKRGS